MSIRNAQRGFSLVELIVLIVVIAVGLAGILIVYNESVRGSADPFVQKQALAVAEAMVDEIQLNAFDPLPGGGATRDQFDDVDDYNGYASAGVVDIFGVAVPGLGSYNVAVSVVADGNLGPGGSQVPATNAKLITVTVSGPTGVALAVTGYKVKYP